MNVNSSIPVTCCRNQLIQVFSHCLQSMTKQNKNNNNLIINNDANMLKLKCHSDSGNTFDD